ncbi:CaiB/BaiF CoA transferase family protein [Terricaulis sp.]|uniref:CaiB/BaiF CoA transferase family protein n=1 Tax=Terricaulis sp. TaxID=2768686 RepID=UPI0037846CE4
MLKGLKVIDYATYVAAPGCAGILADWGADVIKVEPPGGDPIRLFFASLGASDGPNPVFDMDNRGKRGMVLDTAQAAGRDALLKLVDGADVFITNVRPGGLKRAGLDHDALLARCPTLIYGSMTGYGLDGPDADRPGMDSAAFWARSGLAAMFRPKGGEPVALRTAFGDHVAAMGFAAGILAALYERNTTGKGRLVEASLLRAAHYAAGSDFAIQHVRGRIASNRQRADVPNPLINYWKTADNKWLTTLTRLGEKDWAKFARALRVEHLIEDPRFANSRARRDNGAALVQILDEAFAARPLEEVAAALDAEQMIWSPVLTAAESITDPQAIAAGCVVQTPSADGGHFNAPAAPIRFPGGDDGPKGPPPGIGQHTREILAELGYAAAEIDAMFSTGAAA